MEERRYRFPEGIVTIGKEEMREVLGIYEVVEIPGSVKEVVVDGNFGNDKNSGSRDGAADSGSENRPDSPVFVLNEGTVSVKNTGSRQVLVNIPDSLMEMEGVRAPRVTILPISFRRAYHVSGIEYLQAYPQADVRYPWDDGLKHFVLLGDELPYIVHRFEHVPDGCVIHTESEKMAETVLKYVDADKIYVIPDAEEWKGFPASRLEKDYEPESLLTARQIEIRKENQAKRDAEEAKKQEKLRQEGKARSIKKMVEPIIMPVLEGLLGPQETVIDWRYQETLYKYSVSVTEGKTPADTMIVVKASVISGLEINYHNQYKSRDFSALAVVVSFAATEFPNTVSLMAEQITKVRDFLEAHREVIDRYHLIPGDEKFKPECGVPGVALPFMDTVIVGSVDMERIGEEVVEIREFAAELERLVVAARGVLPRGFKVIAVER